ncbi:baseplate J/gp47 family protein [Clostridium frigidicarnis]|uniref:Uncharacterized phage protein gp47/JayE n=1 Tax=Clostridium frigidicarnis TaxID=84698 RepID=A0A1I0V1V8_9CLOT|nr:baseplate J/gp47 family protein [Clostridium frigidicarnis]SFA70027.1 Uncharacterized phage protein gp47/JayE [Clostridium frigidicarnis]
MYENKTPNVIHNEMLDNISNDYAKNIGYPMYDLTKSFAIEASTLYNAMQEMINKLDVDKLEGKELEKYIYQRKGLKRKIATNAKGIIIVKGNGQINKGDLFSTAIGIRFRSLETKKIVNEAEISIEAIQPGSTGIVGQNTITQMPVTLQGIVSVTNINPTYDGYDSETDESLRQRYYEALQIPATSANKFHYIKWSKEVIGVGNVKVIPLWNGDNTVKVVIIDDNNLPANEELINRVQTYIDPVGVYNEDKKTWSTWGSGSGEAPIGAYTTVVSATALLINISVDIQEMNNYKSEDVLKNIKTDITNYLKEIAFKQDFISYARVGAIILNTEGVQDYKDLNINGGSSNITISNEEVATLGSVEVI